MNGLIENLSMAIPIFMIFSLFLGVAAYFRYLKFKETVALAENGLIRSSNRHGRRPQRYLKWGVILISIGVALFLGLLTIGIGPWLLGGLIPMSFGGGLVVIGYLTENDGFESIHDVDDELLHRKMDEE